MALTKVSYSMIDSAPISVLDYGAVGDGVTNDGPAVQLAINAVAAAGRGCIVFPAGKSYFMNTQVNVCNNLVVMGYGAKIIAGRAWAHIDAPLFKNFTAARMSVAPGTITATANVSFYGLEFDGQDTGGASGVPNANMHGLFICMGNRTDVASGVTGFTVQDCYLHDFDGAGVFTYGGQNINVSNNRFVNFFPNTVLSIGSGLSLTDVDGFVIDANVFDHTGANWSWHGMTILDFNSRSKNGTVSNNVIRNMNNGDGISCEGNTFDNLENVTFVGNMIRDCAGDGIGVDNSTQVVISANTIQDIGGIGFVMGQTERLIINGNSLINVGLSGVYGSGDKITITGNSFTGTTYYNATYQGDAIIIVPTAPSSSNSAQICGNYFKDIDGAGVILAENGIVTGNFFFNVGRNALSNRRNCVIGGDTSVITDNIFQSIGNTNRAVSCSSNPPTLKNNQILGTYLDCKVYIGFRNNVATGLTLNQDRIEADGPTDQMTIWDTAYPGTGYWLQGDIVYDSSPTADGSIGWVVVSTPSVWAEFGAITQVTQWTPRLRGSTGEPGTLLTGTGGYVKVGNVVHLSADFANVDTTGYSGNVTVDQLPFQSAPAFSRAAGTVSVGNFPVPDKYVVCSIDESQSVLGFSIIKDGALQTLLQHSAGAGRFLRFTISYFVA